MRYIRMSVKIVLLLMMCLFITGCRNIEKDLPEGPILSQDFKIDGHIQENAVYQHSSYINISGEALENAVIVASIYDSKEKLIEQSFGIVDETGHYEFTIDTPKGSYKTYSLIISDKNKLYRHEYKNIHFGEVFLLLGENNLQTPMEEPLNKDLFGVLYNNLYLYDYSVNGGSWLTEYNPSDLTAFMYEYYKKISALFDYPIAFMKVLNDTTTIEEWLSLSDVKASSAISTYLEVTGRYYEAPYMKGQMSYLYNTALTKLFPLSFNTIIWDNGLTDLININKEGYPDDSLNMYSKMLHMVIKNLNRYFVNRSQFVILQKQSIDIENINKMRNIDDLVANYFNRVSLLPIYDLVQEDEVTNEYYTDILDIVKRFYDVVNGKKNVSGYANLICDYNDDEEIIKIYIEFSDTMHIYDINDFANLYVYDQLGEVIEVSVSCNYNLVILDLAYTKIIIDEETKLETQEVFYYQVSTIEYAQEKIVVKPGIENAYHLPVIPFIITINAATKE